MLVEALESRAMMAVAPHLAGIQPNVGNILAITNVGPDGVYNQGVDNISVLTNAPQELRLSFDENQIFPAGTPAQPITGVRITRAGSDQIFGTTDDATVPIGFMGADAVPNQNVIVVRFAQALPDDLYRVEMFGTNNVPLGITSLKNTTGDVFVPDPNASSLAFDRQTVDFKLDLGAKIVGVVPQPVVRVGSVLTQIRDRIDVYFNDDDLYSRAVTTGDLAPNPDPTVIRPEFYQLIYTKDSVQNTDDTVYNPISVKYDPLTDKAELTFAAELDKLVFPGTGGEATFRLRVGTNELTPVNPAPLPPITVTPTISVTSDFNTGGQVTIGFTALKDNAVAPTISVTKQDLGAGAMPQVTVAGNAIAVILNTNAISPSQAQDLVNAINGNAAASAIVTAAIVTGNPIVNIAAPAINYSPIKVAGVGSSFGTASDLGNLAAGTKQNQIVSSSIDPQSYQFNYPGTPDTPGSRNVPLAAGDGGEQHTNPAFPLDITDGVTTIAYNFKSNYGSDPSGNPLINAITEPEKQRVRESLEIWSQYLGVQFIETASSGLTFALGELRALNPQAPDVFDHPTTFNMRVRVDPNYANSLVVLDVQRAWNEAFGNDFFRVATLSIGYMLGLGRAADLPAQTLMALNTGFINNTNAALEQIFPGSYDIMHGQLLHRTDSNDIDMYRFSVDLPAEKNGLLSAQIIAERQQNSSLLDSVLHLYREIPSTQASVTEDFNTSGAVSVKFAAVQNGRRGNEISLFFSKSDHGGPGAPSILVNGSTIFIDLNTNGGFETTAQQLINAINSDPVANTLISASLASGVGVTNIASPEINYSPLTLTGGSDLSRELIASNDDYYSKDSFLEMSLPAGVYYLGVSAKGNEQYDPVIEDTGFGGRTQGRYQLQINFRPSVDADAVIRDQDNVAVGQAGTPFDGDADGTPGGIYNFWFQVRPLNRVVEMVGNGSSIADGQVVTVANFQGVVRRFEFDSNGSVTAGNVAVPFVAGASSAAMATSLATAISGATGFNNPSMATASGNRLTLLNDRTMSLSTGLTGLVVIHGKTIFVDKAAGPQADGSLARPFNNIANATVPNAFSSALPGDIVRIVGNGGTDGNLATVNDAFAYEVGFGTLPGQILTDGSTMEVPRGVTVMVDGGAVFKLRSARIGVGSSNVTIDRSQGAMQVLGTPSSNVYFTSWLDETIGRDTFAPTTFATPGNWGGIMFKNDLDHAKGQFDYESQGIFLNYVNGADIRYGGGIVNVDSVGQVVQPIQMSETRPTVTNNFIRNSADSAMSADPDSFEETNFNAPRFQQASPFTPDYARIGPEIHGNILVNNSINALFVRVDTPAGNFIKPLTTPARFNDTDIVHYIAENVEIQGTPGGPFQDSTSLPLGLVALTPISAGTLPAGTYNYRLTMLDENGFESVASAATINATLGTTGAIRIDNLPAATTGFVSRRIYRSAAGGGGPYTLISELNSNGSSYLDNGTTLSGTLDTTVTSKLHPRLDARLAIDPGTVVKLEGARLEVSFGAQLIAEGKLGREVIFTSKLDDRYGAGGTFDTNNDATNATPRSPTPADWSGIYLGATSSASIDHALLAYGGGISRIEGTFKAFNLLEVRQADLRLTNSVIEQNASGVGGQGPTDRLGRLPNAPAVIYVSGAQPVIVGNTFRDNDSQFLPSNPPQPVISIDVNSLTSTLVPDLGRQTGEIGLVGDYRDNFGPLVRENRQSRNGINGMLVRGGTLTTESIWDDTDIVHVVMTNIDIQNYYINGGLRLQSGSDESLVVKLSGSPGNWNNISGAGFSARGTPLDIDDRIGGTLHVVGQPGHPVILTSLQDDTAGAGLKPDNSPQNDTNNDGIATVGRANDWRGLTLDQYSNDRNVDIQMETEARGAAAPGPNASTLTAQFLGSLAANEQGGDENLRLGFELHGLLNDSSDVDVYSFSAIAGTEIWLDIDFTTYALDSLVEVLDAQGNVIARSDNSTAEYQGLSSIFKSPSLPSQYANPLVKSPFVPRDFGTLNARDAGMRLILPGTLGERSTYHFRIRSEGENIDLLDDGKTSGAYQVQLRLRQIDEKPGSTVRYADIRYAQNGIDINGLPIHSPLTGEASETEEVAVASDPEVNNGVFTITANTPGRRPQDVGNVLASDRAVISIGGSIADYGDIDVYSFDVTYTNLFNPGNPTLHAPLNFDIDYADGLNRADTTLAIFTSAGRLVFVGRDANIADDLPRPLHGNDLTDLSRGSIGTRDGYIGTVELPEGTYLVAVSHNQQLPAALFDPLARVEPIDTVRRIAEDHIGVNGTGGSTFDGPVVPVLLDPGFVGTGTNLWHVTNRRAADNGHGLTDVIDGTRSPTTVSTTVDEVEPNNTLAVPQNLENEQWSLATDANFGNLTGGATSTTLPHITINGTGDGTVDYYSFTVPASCSVATPCEGYFDIDGGVTGNPGSIDTQLFLYDSTGNLVLSNDQTPIVAGGAGSSSNQDPFIDFLFTTPGTYVIGVAKTGATGNPGGISGPAPQSGDQYTLRVSLEDHPLTGTFARGGSSFYFGNEGGGGFNTPGGPAAGSLLSNSFNLGAYSAADLPVLYFNYLVSTGSTNPGDRLRVYARDDSTGNETLLASNFAADAVGSVRRLTENLPGNNNWRQARLELDRVAGIDNLKLRFEFIADGVNDGAFDGAYIDDLVIGFAERGEMVSYFPGANTANTAYQLNPDFIPNSIPSGQYQLEIRRGTDFGVSTAPQPTTLSLTKTIDTNDRQSDQTTLVAPRGSLVSDGETFVIGDGINDLTFEYDSNGIIAPGNIGITFASSDPDYVIAQRIRDAINSPTAQTRLSISASSSNGTIVNNNPLLPNRDNRINLYGPAVVDFAERSTGPMTVNIPMGNVANTLRDAILGTGITAVGNATMNGGPTAGGLFNNGGSSIGYANGIVLSTGSAFTAAAPNLSDNSSSVSSNAADAGLDTAFGVATTDATELNFDFQFGDGSTGGDLFWQFVFASEEYNELVNALNADVFALFIDGARVFLNPIDPVDRNSVNGGNPLGAAATNPELYNQNDPNDGGRWQADFGFDGFTNKMTASLLGLAPGVHTARIVIGDVGNQNGDSGLLIPTGGFSTVAPAAPQAITGIRYTGPGDSNVFRDQGQIIISSNIITDSRDFGITSEGGTRRNIAGVAAPIGSPVIGPVRKLPNLNNQSGDTTGPHGGLVPGVVIVNNIISGDGLGGIYTAGDVQPIEITTRRGCALGDSGDMYADGTTFSLTFNNQTLTFEYEDIGGGDQPPTNIPCGIPGSFALGGNNYGRGNVPIYYRHTQVVAGSYPVSGPYSQTEMAFAIANAIQGSLFGTNGTTNHVNVFVAPSQRTGIGGVGDPAVYVTGIDFFSGPDIRRVPTAQSPVPFAHIVNNTIYGDDGLLSSTTAANVEANDNFATAIDTRQGQPHNPQIYSTSAAIGDNQALRGNLAADVDFYRFQLNVGDHATIDIDTVAPSSLDSYLRLFDESGKEVAFSDNAIAPGEAVSNDSYIDFTATKPGTYYAAVSSRGNQTYNPIGSGGRTAGATTGNYTLNVDVRTPRTAVINMNPGAVPQTIFSDTDAFTIEDVVGNVYTFEIDTGGGVTAGRIPIPIDPTVIPQPATFQHGPGYGRDDVMVAIANAINGATGASNIQNLPNAPFGPANPISPIRATALGGIGGVDFTGPPAFTVRTDQVNVGHDVRFTSPNASDEMIVVLQNISRIVNIRGFNNVFPSAADNNDQYWPETGVWASQRSSPTLLNNVFANLNRGFFETPVANFTPNTPVVGGSIFQGNVINTTVSGAGIDFNIQLSPTDPLFVNAPDRNFYPAPNSQVIDSAVSSLLDRDDFANRVKGAVGIAPSPIIAPDRDQTGELRIDDPNVASPQGVGVDPFRDRGALDRADFVTPTAVLVNPQDNDAQGVDADSTPTVVKLTDGTYSEFVVQIADQFGADNPFPGTGADDNTIETSPVPITENGLPLTLKGPAISVYANGQLLREGFDYTFRYDSISNSIHLTPLAGVWADDKVFEIRLNNRDRFVIDAPDGQSLNDGASFTVTDNTGSRVTFEFESGYRFQVPAVLAFQVPLASGAITDGQRFTIDDGKNVPVIFEFDTNGSPPASPIQAVTITAGSSPDQIAQAMVAAIQQAVTNGLLVGLSPKNLGQGLVHVGATGSTSVSVVGSNLTANMAQRPLSLTVPQVGVGPGGITDGQTFVITNGAITRTFEFDNNLVTAPGAIRVGFAATSTIDQLTSAIATAISSPAAGLTLTAVSAGPGTGVVLLTNATPAHTVNVRNTVLTREMFIGGVRDGESFTITNGANPPVTFEFDNNGVFVDANNDTIPDNQIISLTTNDAQNDIANKIVTAITNGNVGMSPINFGQGVVQIGGVPGQVINKLLAPSLILTGLPGVQPSTTLQLPVSLAVQVPALGGAGIVDGETFKISNGIQTVTFEFDSDGVVVDANNDFIPDNVVISYSTLFNANAIATLVVNAINTTSLGLTPVNRGNGLVVLGSAPVHSLDMTGSSLVSSLRVNGLADGASFTIDDGTVSRVFEFEDTVLNNGVTAGRVPIFFTTTDLADQVANAVASAIQSAGLGSPTNPISPANVGNGAVRLNDTGRYATTLPPLSPITKLGVPGSAIPVPITISASFTDSMVAQAIVAAMNGPAAALQLSGVTATIRGGSAIYVDFSDSLGMPIDFDTSTANVGGISNYFLRAIQDQAGNPLRSNQSNGDTQYTIIMPDVGLDYGDAPDPFSGPGRYPTLQASDGARHAIVGANPLVLGQIVDRDPDGQQSANANGDDTDIVIDLALSPGLVLGGAAGTPTIQVKTIGAGLADVLDEQTFTINDRGQTVTFEFDRNESVTDGRTVITFSNTSTPNDVANGIIAAMNRAGIAATATIVGNGLVQIKVNDDDGIQFVKAFDPSQGIDYSNILNRNLDTGVQVIASGPGFLDAWIDYNQDGDWEDPGEQIFASVPVVAGVNLLKVHTINSAASGDTYARFRLSSSGGLLPTGLAVDGEVEDYRVTIQPGTPPVANNDGGTPGPAAPVSYRTNEDTTLNTGPAQGLLFNDTDAENDPLIVTEVLDSAGNPLTIGVLATLPSGATLIVEADGSFVFNPATSAQFNALPAGSFATEVFTYRISDQTVPGGLPSGMATVTLTVTGVNDAPVAKPDTYNIDEDSVLADNVITNPLGLDTDPDTGNTIAVSAINGVTVNVGGTTVLPSGAVLQLNADGSFTYDPRPSTTLQALAAGQAGVDTFNYTIRDVAGLTSSTLVTINVGGLNDVPVARNDAYTTTEDATITGQNVITLGAGADSDPDTGATVNVSAVNGAAGAVGVPTVLPSGATVTLLSNGTLTYNPTTSTTLNALPVGQSTTDVFTYTITDGQPGSFSTATVTVTVNGVNDAPTPTNDNFTTNENTPRNGNFITGSNGNGPDTDPDGGETAQLVVSLVNGLAFTPGVAFSLPSGATLTVNANGSFSYDAGTSPTLNALAQGQTGADSFTYTVRDPQNATGTATVNFTITGINDPPVATADAFTTDENTAATGNVITGSNGNGPDSDPDTGDTALLVVTAVNGISNSVGQNVVLASGATLRINANGSLTYNPNTSPTLNALRLNQTATDTFTYTISDNKGGNATATVTMTVNGLNDAPIAVNNAYTTTEDATRNGNVISDNTGAGVDSDPDTGDVLTISGVQDANGVAGTVGSAFVLPSGATVTLNGNGTFVYNPTTSTTLAALRQGQTGTDSFRYVLSDGQTTSTATVNLTITGVNDPPLATADLFVLDENTQVIGNVVTGNNGNGPDRDIDAGNGAIVLTAVNGVPANVGAQIITGRGATLTVTSTGALSYNPLTSAVLDALQDGQIATDVFNYTIVSTNGLSSIGTVTMRITGINDPPRVVNDSVTTAQGVPITISVLNNDTDVDGTLKDTSVSIVAGSGPSSGTAVVNANGTITYTPVDATFTGTVTFRYTVRDNNDAISPEATVTIVVQQTPSPWRNALNPLDINADGSVSPLDALILINELNKNGPHPLANPTSPPPPPPYLDPNNNRSIEPADVLMVINFLNSVFGPEGEGSGEATPLSSVSGVNSLADSQFVAIPGSSLAAGVLSIDHRWNTGDQVSTASSTGASGRVDDTSFWRNPTPVVNSAKVNLEPAPRKVVVENDPLGLDLDEIASEIARSYDRTSDVDAIFEDRL